VTRKRSAIDRMFDPWRAAMGLRRPTATGRAQNTDQDGTRPAMPRHASPTATKKISLALQGGGAHGAFTWGVLDHLLEDGRLAIGSISGGSAGAINAVMLADGLIRGGSEGGRARLAEFWKAASFDGNLPTAQRAALDRILSYLPSTGSPFQAWINAWSRYLSPYDINPLNINPLKELIERFVDFNAIRSYPNLEIFVSATNVHTGKVRVFRRPEVTADAVMASAALPYFFHAVEIDGVPYWDGGYTGNPPLYPLLGASQSADVLVVQINPLMRHTTPTSTQEILNRINEITFNSSLSAEIRVVELLSGLLERGELRSQSGDYRPIRLHRIALGTNKPLPTDSKLNNDYDFFELLFRSGKRAARRFLDENFDNIGLRSTINHTPDVEAEAAA
jgi:NTE family protein